MINYNLNIQNKKLVAFDVDGTLSPSRSPVDAEMASLLVKLLAKKQVAIITGGAFNDIKGQVLNSIGVKNEVNKNLILLPTNGGGLFIYDDTWTEVSSHKLTPEEKNKIISAIQEITGCDEGKAIGVIHNDKIQDRGSEITYSALGEFAKIEDKHAWDPNFNKRIGLQKKLAEKLPEFEVKIGGTTSIDITPKGMDKSYGIKKLMDYLRLEKKDILFVGDAVYENGNDYPVYLMGVDTIKVSSLNETKEVIRSLFGQ